MTQQRLDSIDVFRGLTVAAMLLVNNAGDWSHVYPWLEHASWNGCTLADFIFPFFLVIVGVSMELAYAPKMSQGIPREVLFKSAWHRSLKIIALGIVLHIIAMVLIPDRHFRLFGVLQRIGICFGVVAAAVLFLSTTRRLMMLIVAILIGYGLLIHFGGGYDPHLNLADRVDTAILGPWAYQYDPLSFRAQEPEGILTTIPALTNVLLGVLGARLLRERRMNVLLWCACGMILMGFLSQSVIPWNKQLWTSSFVIWTCGWAYVLIAVFHVAIDLWRVPAIGVSFGRNAIIAYAAAWIATCLLAATNAMNLFYPEVFAGGLGPIFGLEFASFAFAAVFTCLFGGLMYALRRLGIRVSL